MICFKYQVMTMGAAALLLGSCGGDDDSPLDGIAGDLAKQCGIDIKCEAGGVAEGNASISGVASVDAFFQSVINFQARADMVASGIDAEISAIGASFGIEGDVAAGLKTQIDANLEAGLVLDYEPAKCAVDAQASVDVAARCEGEVNPPKAMVACEGSCEVEASADVKCEGSAKLECTLQGPEIECSGKCQGGCTVEAGAACSGTCNGACEGTCSVMNADGQCAGSCDGMCMGSCETNFAAECSGTCNGECTIEKEGSAGCDGGVRASCKAEANAMVMCEGRCDGKVEPPSAKAECQASAKAEASMSVECTPPQIALRYEFKAGVSAEAQAEFEAGIRSLEAHLPALLVSVRKAEFILDAGADLGASAESAVKGAVMELDGGANLRVVAGLKCALGELDTVAGTLTEGSARLSASAKAAADLQAALQ